MNKANAIHMLAQLDVLLGERGCALDRLDLDHSTVEVEAIKAVQRDLLTANRVINMIRRELGVSDRAWTAVFGEMCGD